MSVLVITRINAGAGAVRTIVVRLWRSEETGETMEWLDEVGQQSGC